MKNLSKGEKISLALKGRKLSEEHKIIYIKLIFFKSHLFVVTMSSAYRFAFGRPL